LSTFCRYKQVI